MDGVLRSSEAMRSTPLPPAPSSGLITATPPTASTNARIRLRSAVTHVRGIQAGNSKAQSFSLASRSPLGSLTISVRPRAHSNSCVQ